MPVKLAGRAIEDTRRLGDKRGGRPAGAIGAGRRAGRSGAGPGPPRRGSLSGEPSHISTGRTVRGGAVR